MKIYAYVDRSPFAESVWKHAAWVSKQLDFPVEIVHVLDQPTTTTRDYSGYLWLDNPQSAMEERVRLDQLQNQVLVSEGRQLLDSIADSVRAEGVSQVSQRLYQGTLLDHLKEYANENLVAVIGKRGEGANQDSQHLGRNVERLVRSAHRPILMVGPEFAPVERATIAWDGGKSAGKAVNLLASRPLLHGIPTTLLYVTEDASSRRPPSLTDALEHLNASGMEVSISGRSGEVVDEILKSVEEEDSQLLVMGAYGHSRIRQLVIGSTTTEILMRSETSVLVFH